MALLADRIAPGPGQPRRINDIVCAGMRGMFRALPVATLATDAMELREILQTVERSMIRSHSARVAEKAIGCYRPVQVRSGVMLVTGGHSPRVAKRIVSDGSLVKVTIFDEAVASPHASRADIKIERLFMPRSDQLQLAGGAADLEPVRESRCRIHLRVRRSRL